MPEGKLALYRHTSCDASLGALRASENSLALDFLFIAARRDKHSFQHVSIVFERSRTLPKCRR